MATPQQIQDQIDLTAPSTRIVRSVTGAGTTDEHYTAGGQAPHHGRARWVQTVAANTAAQQAAAILAGLLL